MPPRFTIRDLLWLALVISLFVAWWWEHSRRDQLPTEKYHGASQEMLKRFHDLDEQMSIQNRNHLKLQEEMQFEHAAEVESFRARLKIAERQQWFRELPLVLSGDSRVLLLTACAYAAWDMKAVYERKAWFRSHPVRVEIDISDVPYFRKFSLGDPSQEISTLRLWMGDRRRQRVYVLPSVTTEEKRTAAELFPEAEILEIPKGYP